MVVHLVEDNLDSPGLDRDEEPIVRVQPFDVPEQECLVLVGRPKRSVRKQVAEL